MSRPDFAGVLAEHRWGDDTALVGTHAVQCGCGWKATDRDIYALRARHDQHRADVLTSAGFGPVRAVEEERDAAREKAVWWERTCASWNEQAAEAQRFRDLNAARTESAEAALARMTAFRDECERQFQAKVEELIAAEAALATALTERDEALAALEAGDACGAVGCRALAERDRLRARLGAVEALVFPLAEGGPTDDELLTVGDLRAALANPPAVQGGWLVSIDWDDVENWGGRVHVAAWCADGKHDDETEEE